ncbi:MAG: hypothetical protein ACOVS5_09995 [Oligoflexus sp.]|jgi:DNA-binding phage protein
MAKRSKQYDSDTALKLRDPEYAEGYLNAAILNHETPFKIALADMIDKFGHAEFGERIDWAASNVSREVRRLRDDKDVKLDTLHVLLNGFGLSLKMQVQKLGNLGHRLENQ